MQGSSERVQIGEISYRTDWKRISAFNEKSSEILHENWVQTFIQATTSPPLVVMLCHAVLCECYAGSMQWLKRFFHVRFAIASNRWPERYGCCIQTYSKGVMYDARLVKRAIGFRFGSRK